MDERKKEQIIEAMNKILRNVLTEDGRTRHRPDEHDTDRTNYETTDRTNYETTDRTNYETTDRTNYETTHRSADCVDCGRRVCWSARP